ncbi:MAG: 30S ribosomal protein S6 [Magnetococcales bacterium]|nr:30S ribosomal protein S6 [Magnetococcales bacterium]
MPYYESIYILRPDLTTEQVERINTRVTAIIEKYDGKILKTELWGRRQLAYPIKKNAKGYYVFHMVEGRGPLMRELEERLRIDEDVLKYQNIRIQKLSMDSSPLAPAEERREVPAADAAPDVDGAAPAASVPVADAATPASDTPPAEEAAPAEV